MSHPPNDQSADAFHCHKDEGSQDRTTLDPIFQAGVEARAAGQDQTANPYAAGTEERREWSAGWSATVDIDGDTENAGSLGQD